MTQPDLESRDEPTVCMDSTVLFDITHDRKIKEGTGSRRHVADDELLDFFVAMCSLVEHRILVFPRQVMGEAKAGSRQDLAKAFAAKAWNLIDESIATPDEAHVKRVVNRSFAGEFGWADVRVADPRVIALAVTMKEKTNRPCFVATRDGPMIDCCADYEIEVLDTPEFVQWVLDWKRRRLD